MRKTTAMVVAIVVAIFAIMAPVALALHLARKQALGYETKRVLQYARDVLRRTEGSSDQIRDALRKLKSVGSAGPCSEASLAIMRNIDLTASYLQGIGYVSDDRLLCSSMGVHGAGLPLGPAGAKTLSGSSIRQDVEFEFARGTLFTVVEVDGYAAIVHKDLPINVTTQEKDASLATFTASSRQFRSSRGVLRQEWLEASEGRGVHTLVDDTHLVVVLRSERYDSGAVAALPLAYLDEEWRGIAMFLFPTGLGAGVALALAVLYLARLRFALPAVLKGAIKRKEFFLVYQPIVDLKSGRWVGAEALIRWQRPSGEMVRPDVFIQVAEDSGLIQRVTERVLEIIARDAAGVFVRHPHFHIAINVSAADLHSFRIVELLGRLAAATGAAPGNLMVEATERGFLDAGTAREVVRKLRAGGMRVAMDDFGTGYSSLSYLETFEFDLLKIDKSFVDTLGKDAATSQVVPHIIEMAKTLGLEMIAEGVETEAQAQFLRERGVQFAQGWLFGKPMRLEDVVESSKCV